MFFFFDRKKTVNYSEHLLSSTLSRCRISEYLTNTRAMGAAASLTNDRFIMRILFGEIQRPLDASDVDTPRESA